MMARPTSSMKKGWLYRTSCDEKNHEIAPVKIQCWWSSRDDSDQGMTQIHRWCSSDDDPDWVMIQIQVKMTWIWRWLGDEGDLKIEMTWRWRWWRLDDDPDDIENTFLVKRECRCNCNFGMYSLVFLMYCNPMFIPWSIYNVLESCHALRFQSGVFIM